MQIQFTPRCIQYYGDACFMKPTVDIWCKKIPGGQILASGTVSFFSGLDSSQHRSLHREFRSLATDGTKCLNEI